jgi:hypothetical protein
LGATLLLFAAPRGAARLWPVLDRFGGPALVIAFLFLVLPLSKATGENYYYGAKSLDDTVSSLFDASLLHTPERSLMASLGPGLGKWLRSAALPAAFFAVLVGGIVASLKILKGRDLRPAALLFATATAVLGFTVLALIAMNSAGILYPLGRTGLYLLPLFTLCCILGAALLETRGWYGRAAAGGAYAVLALILAIYVSQFNIRFFTEWRFDASTNEVVRRLSEHHRTSGETGTVSIGSSWLYGETLKYYQKRRRLGWIETIDTEKLTEEDFDYYVLVYEDTQLVNKLGLAVLYRDPVSGAVLAHRPAGTAHRAAK